jgi:hypothetical protein
VVTAAAEAKKIVVEQQANREKAEAARKARMEAEAELNRKLAAGEMTLEQVKEAKTRMEAEELERKAAEIGLAGGPVPEVAPLPEVAVDVEGPREDRPLTLEERLALARRRQQQLEQQAGGAAAPAEASEPAASEAASEAPAETVAQPAAEPVPASSEPPAVELADKPEDKAGE